MKRLIRYDYFMKVSELTALRGTCPRLQVGCVLVDEETHRIAAVGYNSSHKNQPHCTDEGCLMVDGHCIRTLHAEQAAVLNLERKYDKLVCFTTHNPCINCFKVLVGANIKTIWYLNDYQDEKREILNQSVKIFIGQFLYSDPRTANMKIELIDRSQV
ncbi:MAG: cytidine/deoxycytidylate deaminase family protein [Candidatus Thorarchaeota archaeon]